MASGFKLDTRPLLDVATRMRRLSSTQRAAGEAGIAQAALIMDRDLKETALNAGRPQRVGLFMQSRIGFALGVRSGLTAASVTTLIARRGATLEASVGTAEKHVLTNELGATVHAKGRALAIPTVNALSPSGALSNQFAGLGSLRDARDKSGGPLFVLKTRGAAWLAGKGDGRRPTLYFLLRASVEIPARYMFRNARRRVEPLVQEAVEAPIGVKVQEAFR